MYDVRVRGPSFSSPEVCRLARVSYRQLDYWDRSGLASPSIASGLGSGTRRLYSTADVARVRMIRLLLDAGLSLQRIRRYLDGVLEDELDELERVVGRVRDLAETMSA